MLFFDKLHTHFPVFFSYFNMLPYTVQVAKQKKTASSTSERQSYSSLFIRDLLHAYALRIVSILTYKALNDFLIPSVDHLAQ